MSSSEQSPQRQSWRKVSSRTRKARARRDENGYPMRCRIAAAVAQTAFAGHLPVADLRAQIRSHDNPKVSRAVSEMLEDEVLQLSGPRLTGYARGHNWAGGQEVGVLIEALISASGWGHALRARKRLAAIASGELAPSRVALSGARSTCNEDGGFSPVSAKKEVKDVVKRPVIRTGPDKGRNLLENAGTYWEPIGNLLGTYWGLEQGIEHDAVCTIREREPIGNLLGTYWEPIGNLFKVQRPKAEVGSEPPRTPLKGGLGSTTPMGELLELCPEVAGLLAGWEVHRVPGVPASGEPGWPLAGITPSSGDASADTPATRDPETVPSGHAPKPVSTQDPRVLTAVPSGHAPKPVSTQDPRVLSPEFAVVLPPGVVAVTDDLACEFALFDFAEPALPPAPAIGGARLFRIPESKDAENLIRRFESPWLKTALSAPLVLGPGVEMPFSSSRLPLLDLRPEDLPEAPEGLLLAAYGL